LIHTGFFSLFSLPFLTKNKPSVWTIHDPWAITGHCIYPYECKDYTKGCGRCKILNSPLKMKFDNTKLMWKIKKFIYKKTKINIIVASEYMYKIVKNNSLLKDKNIAIIPFGINLNVYKPKNQDNCKKKFNIDKDCFTIFFRSTKNEYKGLIYIQECLNKIFTTKKIAIITIDQKGLIDEFKDRFQIVELGWTQDDQTIADAYNACDVFLMPSTAEAFGLMAVEAMSCGKTVIAFKGTSLEEVLDAPYGGVVVSMKNSNELTKALELLIENPDVNKNIGKKALKIAQNRYDEKIYLEKTINFYEEILNE